LLWLLLVAIWSLGCSPLDYGPDTTQITSTTTTTGRIEVGLDTSELGGLGDEYLPQAGNAGYDVSHYTIDLDCDPSEGSLEGKATIEAEALVSLERFHLDLVGLQVDQVTVDGAVAGYRRDGQELIVECPQAIDAGSGFTVEVVYAGSPQSLVSAEGYPTGWQRSGDTVFTLDEPEGAATWYPVNDHPSDKATYSFYLTVPDPYEAVANGELVSTQRLGADTTFVWEMDRPMANYLAAVVMGDLVVERSTSPDGVPIRNYFSPQIAEEASEVFKSTGEALDFFSELFGPYPFDEYGVVVPDADTSGAAMENQTMALYGRDTVLEQMADEITAAWYLSHELAHEWFGNSLTPAEWQDIWLNEGFATYSSWLWLEHEFGKFGMQAGLEYALDAVESEYGVLLGDPGVDQLFNTVVYERGGLTLHALRLSVGDDLFFAILREWAAENAYGNVTTEGFIELVEDIAGEVDGFDPRSFFDEWLYSEELPDWFLSAVER
jgi:aminopeptidase N